MVSTSNIENLPELKLFPEPQGYYRTTTPDNMLLSHTTDEPANTTLQSYNPHDNPVDSRVLMEPEMLTSGPAYYLQKKMKRPMSVSCWFVKFSIRVILIEAFRLLGLLICRA